MARTRGVGGRVAGPGRVDRTQPLVRAGTRAVPVVRAGTRAVPVALAALGAFGALAALGVLGVRGAPASAGTPVTAASVIKASKAAIGAQHSAHVSFLAQKKSSTASESISGDVGTTAGTETVTDSGALLVVRVTARRAFIHGNSSGLISLFGLTATQAKKLGDRWEFWKAGTAQYKGLEKDVGILSLETLLPRAKGTTASMAGSHYVLTWTSAATSSTPALQNTLTISVRTKLPVEEVSTDTAGETVTTTISGWGENIVVQVPPAGSLVKASTISG